jgi:DNA repair exonuclease SbcCD nuclease subunit
VAAARASDAHDRYAPSAASDYERLDYGYWALGHIHIRQQALPGQPVYYAGNLQGRNPREVGAKGGYRVEVRAKAPAEPTFVRFAPVRWERLEVDALPDTQSIDLVVENLVQRVDAAERAPDESLALRIELSGRSPLAHKLRHEETRREIEAELAERTGALEVQLRTRGLSQPVDTEALRASPTVVAKALDLLDAAGRDAARLDALAPEELATPVAPGAERQHYLAELLADLSQELIERSIAGDET